MPSDPPRDAQGKIVPHNHPEISDDSYVVRHINPREVHKGRVSSGAYTESKEGGMSVDVENWMTADGLQPLHYVSVTEGARRFRVGDLHAMGMMVGWDPDGGHHHHGAIWNVPGSTSGRRRIRDMAIAPEEKRGTEAPRPTLSPPQPAGMCRQPLVVGLLVRSAPLPEGTF